MKIAGVVVLYNPSIEDIKNICTYLNELEYLVMVDNSKVNKLDMRNIINLEKVEYYTENDNLGIAKALNVGAQKAIEKGYNWILTMDQDSKIPENGILDMVEYIENNDVRNVGIISPWHAARLDIKKPDQDIDFPLDVMTSGNLVNLDIYKKVDGFKEWLFIDGVDIEYCLNLKKNNYCIVRLNTVVLEHTLGNIVYRNFFGREFMCTNHNYIRNYYMQRNYRYIRDMYVGITPEFCSTLVKIKQIVFKIIMFEPDKYRKVRNILRGISDYKKGVKGKYHFKN